MTTTPVLGATDLVAAQALPETTVNETVRRIEQGAAWFQFKDRDLATPPGSPADGDCYLIAGSPTGAWAGHAGEVTYYQTGSGWKFITPREGMGGGVQDENVAVAFLGGSWVTLAVDGAAAPHTIGLFFTTTPTASEVLMLYTFAEPVDYADDFAGSVGDIGTNPTASFVLTIAKNGASIGTITISTGGAFTFATTGAAESFAAGDQISITAPGTADATAASCSITMKGTRA